MSILGGNSGRICIENETFLIGSYMVSIGRIYIENETFLIENEIHTW